MLPRDRFVGSIRVSYTRPPLNRDAEDKMEKLIDLFCHAMRITDPLSIKIAVGMVGGGIPLLFLSALFIWLGQLAASQREAEMPVSRRPAHRKGRAARKSPAATK